MNLTKRQLKELESWQFKDFLDTSVRLNLCFDYLCFLSLDEIFEKYGFSDYSEILMKSEWHSPHLYDRSDIYLMEDRDISKVINLSEQEFIDFFINYLTENHIVEDDWRFDEPGCVYVEY